MHKYSIFGNRNTIRLFICFIHSFSVFISCLSRSEVKVLPIYDNLDRVTTKAYNDSKGNEVERFNRTYDAAGRTSRYYEAVGNNVIAVKPDYKCTIGIVVVASDNITAVGVADYVLVLPIVDVFEKGTN